MDKLYTDYKFQVEFEKILNNFLKIFENSVKKPLTVTFSDEFWCVLNKDVAEYGLIGYTLCISNTVGDIFFRDMVTQYFPDITAPLFLWSFLHELGHYMTNDLITPKQQNEIDSIKASLYLTDDEGNPNANDIARYFKLPDEMLATAWAAAFMRNCPNTVRKLTHKLNRIMKKIVRYNNPEDLEYENDDLED